MIDENIIKEYSYTWATDMAIRALKGSVIINEDVINQSIEMILGTPKGSRLFNLYFGSDFSLRLFDNITSSALNSLLDVALKDIMRFEDRIRILGDDVRLVARTDQNTIELTIPYIIKERNIIGVFNKHISQ